ncbi:MAG TPA: UDP-N-acetylmuramate dehydrogenase [Dehalococcoidia bacterium]|nr:UDP-N-acetylmuramate dehydrogenase [Dehalococcoidia bacterium]
MSDDLIAELGQIAEVRLDEPMSRHTTFGVGGPADMYVTVKTEDELRQAFAVARRHGVPVYILGSGSNTLVGDKGIRGLVIDNQYAQLEGPVQNGVGLKVRAASGLSFSTLARRLASSGYGGVEWACGIPGTLGGAVVSNAGAYGRSLADVLVGARLTDEKGDIREMKPDDFALGYRQSSTEVLRDAAVLSVDIRVVEGDPEALKARIKEFDQQRKDAQPPGQNCGSVFKNPEGKSAWQYVDEVGLRGHRIGNARFSEKHTNFIENMGGATANDVRALINLAQERIRERVGVDMEREVAFVGEFE